MGTGKEVHRETQERRYEGEGTSQKDNENGKSEGAILERSGSKKKRTRGTELGKYRKVVTERVGTNKNVNGQIKERRKEELRGE
jgi:hypothetical protein